MRATRSEPASAWWGRERHAEQDSPSTPSLERRRCRADGPGRHALTLAEWRRAAASAEALRIAPCTRSIDSAPCSGGSSLDSTLNTRKICRPALLPRRQ
jgi:hypothetical protein